MPVGPAEFPALIADNATTSAVVDLKDKVLCGVFVPAGFVGTAISFLTGLTAAAVATPVQDGAGALYSVDAAASQYVPVDPAKFVGVQFLKVVSDATETGGPLTVTLSAR